MACLLLVLLIGLAVGGCAGLLGGRADRGLMRIAELFMTFPTSILSFFMVGVLGTGLTNVILAIALSHWAGTPEWCVTWWFPCASANLSSPPV